MIALIYEGPKAEYNIFNRLKEVFLANDSVVRISLGDTNEADGIVDASYGGNIFDFYKSIVEDTDIDIIALIQERIKNNPSLARKYAAFLEYDRNMFSEIYLFFDFDIHHTLNYGGGAVTVSPEDDFEEKIKILEIMLDIFSNETENGKLYLNYPMIESLRDIEKENCCCVRCCECLANLPNYKAIVHSVRGDFSDYRRFGKEEWCHFTRHALQKANCVVNDEYRVCVYDIFINKLTQSNIFSSQVDVCKKQNKVFVLNSIPLFLLEYYGAQCWNEEGLLNSCLGSYTLSFSNCSEK